MNRVYARVCEWNAARYDREYNKELTIKLLREEYKEWLEADNSVDKLDGLCDLAYVCMGAIWKGQWTPNQCAQAEFQAVAVITSLIESMELWPAFFIGTFLDVMEHDEGYPDLQSIHLVLTAALSEMSGLGLDNAQCVEAMLVVCDSNDSKTAVKTASDVKANLDKGENFVSPEARLNELLENARGKLN